jgi:predicted HTH domain antitoxin
MKMKTAQENPLLEQGIGAAVRAGLFRDEREALREALSTWFAVKPNLRLEVAIELFKEGVVTLDRAAELAGLNRWTFHDLLIERGVRSEAEADTPEELSAAAAAILKRSK